MDQDYKEAYAHASDCENKLKNLLDDKTHPIGRGLLDEARQLVSEVGARRNPRQLENRAKSILRLLRQAEDFGEEIMDHRHIREVHDGYEHFQMALRKFHNY